MSARFRVGSAIAQQCKKVGFKGTVGYQSFLYSAEADIRKIFMFLVEKLPKKEGATVTPGKLPSLVMLRCYLAVIMY